MARSSPHPKRGPRTAMCAALAGLAALALALPGAALARPGPVPAPRSARLPGAPACGPSTAGREPQAGSSFPPPAPGYFARDFPRIEDSRLGVPIGGFGGLHRRAPLHHTPVIFVHGNQADAQNWLSPMLQLQNDAGYSMQEMYALSYNGLGNYYAGMPTRSPPTGADEDYVRQNPRALANGGHGAANDDEVPDLCRFIEAVQSYTGSRKVDIVAHSLGVTIARETMRLYPRLARDVVAFVGIAGANHGTTVCRGLETAYYGCDEIAPGTPWLARLNGPDGSRETYGPTRWETIYDGSEGDPFYVGPDATSPRLKGARNRTFPGAYHDDLRVDPAEVDTYLAFLLREGQAGPGADRHGAAQAARIAATEPDGRHGTLCGIPRLTGPQPACAGEGGTRPSPRSRRARFERAVARITALPYQPAYVPAGFDHAFPGDSVPNTAPAEDYTSGSVEGSPDSPDYPPPFHQVLLTAPDGAKLYAQVALQPGRRPGIVVVHGFNTSGKRSVTRWAAMLAANGYDVIAADQRDFKAEHDAGYDADRPQTFGWKEAQDVIAAGRYLAAQRGVTSLGIVGFSEGGQNAVLAMARSGGLFDAGLTFSGPADQDTQIYSTAVPPGCSTPLCTFPVTDALVALVVPPYTYTDPCAVLSHAAAAYHTTGFDILARETAFHAQTGIHAPLLNFYAADDPLVQPFQAEMMAGYEQGAPLQRTLEIEHGAHAYYYDRWWQQEAILTYFKALLPGARHDPAVGARATVDRTPGGEPLAGQLVPLGHPTRAEADGHLAPYICDTSAGTPGSGD